MHLLAAARLQRLSGRRSDDEKFAVDLVHCAKSFMSFRNTVVFTTWLRFDPAASRIALIFFQDQLGLLANISTEKFVGARVQSYLPGGEQKPG